jgi:hypothetical protein
MGGMTISPHSDIDIAMYGHVNEDGDDYEVFRLEFDYSDWSIDFTDAAKTFVDALLNPYLWFHGNAHESVVGHNHGADVVHSILGQLASRHMEIIASIQRWPLFLADINALSFMRFDTQQRLTAGWAH